MIQDVLIVGAGFGGMYGVYKFRGMGLSVKAVEAGSDVGGTWYWNRYPGARCDVPSLEYSFGFSEELEQAWEWPEVFSAQPDILDYANHVAERFDLRQHIQFNTRVTSITWRDGDQVWELGTDTGETLRGRFVVMATGCLSVPNKPNLPGAARFKGQVLHTGLWPHEEVSLEGKRVGVIGTGSSGVQAIPELAKQAGHLTVFQRTPVYTVPANRKRMREAVQQEFKDNYREIREMQWRNAGGVSGFRPLKSAPSRANQPDVGPAASGVTGIPGGDSGGGLRIKAMTPEQREQVVEAGGLGMILAFRDIYSDIEANDIANELFRSQIRKIVKNPEVSEKLLPKDYGIGCKRQVLDRDYYDTFNRNNVSLVDLRETPLDTITETGVQVGSDHHELDVLIYATGFDAMTGALVRANITGRDGVTLRDKWADGPVAFMGLQMRGFPNLFTVTGPGSPSVLCNMLVAIEQHVNWIADCVAWMRENEKATIEPLEQSEIDWVAHVNEVAEGTMYTVPSCNSWYLGANIEGKPRIFMPYVGGLPRYREHTDGQAENNYPGFEVLG
ncbi:MAG: NAD(P)/FAD-dependent oxidoreductase [Pseudomonadales bacterium]|nr:NAD(P)/FAD-dependent oxidoreductase [Pseudomonadales bacterium]